MKKKILSWLLFHANTYSCSKDFYAIKKKLLDKYGRYFADDIQFFEGVKCRCCGGTGIYVGYTWNLRKYENDCRYCSLGYFKLPTYVILKRYQFGKYCFHQPYKSVYFKNPIPNAPLIEGYVKHNRTKFGRFSEELLYLIYNRNKLGEGWCLCWHYPSNWLNNIFHIYHKKLRSYPIRKVVEKLKNEPKRIYKPMQPYAPSKDEDLPF